jgi:hypothetical protein
VALVGVVQDRAVVGQEREAFGARRSDQDAIDQVVVELVRQPVALDPDLWRQRAL